MKRLEKAGVRTLRDLIALSDALDMSLLDIIDLVERRRGWQDR